MDSARGTADAPLHAATVILLRDGAAGLEVFLLQRHALSDVHGGAYVFPGGKLDRDDGLLAHRLDQSAAALHGALGEADLDAAQAAALYVAAMREVYEEAGILFAPWTPDMMPVQELRDAGLGFAQLLQTLDLRLSAAALLPWSRWVTPVASLLARKHFDTRFFVAAVPAGQEPRHDAHETTASLWLAPAQALGAYCERRIELAPPQVMSLAELARYRDVAGVLDAARGRRPARIQPEVLQEDGRSIVCYPGDPRHSQPGVCLPGPTRLCWSGGRFEPLGGLESLLG